jgi:tRNA (Thr-GGU) A37 N-methylase
LTELRAANLALLRSVSARTGRVAELDAINGTPVLDIKPVMAEFLPRTPVQQPPGSPLRCSALCSGAA